MALAGPAVRRLGDSAPRWPAGSPAQWQRPQMRGCVMWRDRAAKPSRGRLCVVGRTATTQSAACKLRGIEVINEKPPRRQGGVWRWRE